MIISANGIKRQDIREDFAPVKIVMSQGVENVEGLFQIRDASVTFQTEGWTVFTEKGSYVVLDFGKEICGGIRIITRGCNGTGRWRLTFGESLSEAMSSIGEKNATNDHSPRDFEVMTINMSDLQFGQTGFRFVRMEVLDATPMYIQNIYAVSNLPYMEREAEIITNDTLLNDIIKTAAYTLKLNFQNGYIWDGIKRDRLVWCGDLNPEILTALYMFGDCEHIKNSLTFLKGTAAPNEWINTIPSYSAWWVINLCDYCTITGNWEYFKENRQYAVDVIANFSKCVKEDGELVMSGDGMDYFLDWSTHERPDAKYGVCALVRMMAQKFQAIEENDNCKYIIEKLKDSTNVYTTMKPVRAFQIIAGRDVAEEDKQMLDEGGAKGFSTFMSYYILTAMAKAGSKDMLTVLKEYYGAMLSRGATSFWEDFDIDWLEGSGRIDEMPAEGQKDIHGDYGKYCYQQFRHSLCHGWSSGVVAFIVEHILGVSIKDGGKTITVNPNLMGLTDVEAKIPVSGGMLEISIHGDEKKVKIPNMEG